MSSAHWLSHGNSRVEKTTTQGQVKEEEEKHTPKQNNIAADHKNGIKTTANPEGAEDHQRSLSDITLLYLLLSIYKLKKQKKKPRKDKRKKERKSTRQDGEKRDRHRIAS